MKVLPFPLHLQIWNAPVSCWYAEFSSHSFFFMYYIHPYKTTYSSHVHPFESIVQDIFILKNFLESVAIMKISSKQIIISSSSFPDFHLVYIQLSALLVHIPEFSFKNLLNNWLQTLDACLNPFKAFSSLMDFPFGTSPSNSGVVLHIQHHLTQHLIILFSHPFDLSWVLTLPPVTGEPLI